MSKPSPHLFSHSQIVIIGSGFAGIGMAIRLKQAGIHQFIIVEKAASVGGTWRDNHYPGAGCDIPSHLYSFSFEPKSDWSHMFGKQHEIQQYLEKCIDKYQLKSHLHFNFDVTKALYDSDSGKWQVYGKQGERITTDEVISCSGGLSQPALPDVHGRKLFTGTSFHSAHWDHNYPLKGKKVAVIGTGASAIQFIPEILKQGAKVSLFQRTAPWILPKPERKIHRLEQWLYGKFPGLQRLYRKILFWQHELRATGLVYLPSIMKIGEWYAKRNLKKQVVNKKLREQLTPKYSMGCKRILLSNDYLAAMQHPQLELISSPIHSITEKGVKTERQLHDVDAIIYATGFHAAEGGMPFKVIGKDQQDLHQYWQSTRGAQAYKGTSVTGFPNWHFIVGPNTGLGHNSMILMIESQIDYVLKLIKERRIRGLKSLEVDETAQQQWNEKLQKRLKHTVWQAGGCQSWYQTATGKNTTLWPGFSLEFARALSNVNLENYLQTTHQPAKPGFSKQNLRLVAK